MTAGIPQKMNTHCQPTKPEERRVAVVADCHDPFRNRRADNRRQGRADEEPGERLGSIAGRKPMGQVDDHAGIKPGFGQPEQESHGEKLQDKRAAGSIESRDDLLVPFRASQPQIGTGQRLEQSGQASAP